MSNRFLMSLSRIGEGVTIALDSLRGNKVRAGLTILGVAIGVMVVIVIGSAITGINKSASAVIENLGPKKHRSGADGAQRSVKPGNEGPEGHDADHHGQ